MVECGRTRIWLGFSGLRPRAKSLARAAGRGTRESSGTRFFEAGGGARAGGTARAGSVATTDTRERPGVGALAPWFGSKRTLAPRIVAELGEHSAYFEPFCGSMAVLLAKPRASMETVNDMHGDLVNLARVVQDEALSVQLFARCRRTLMSEAMFREAAARWKARGRTPAPGTPDLDRAVDFFYTSWVGRNGVTGTASYNQGFAARYTRGGGHGGTRWQAAVGSIPDWFERLQDVVILSRCGFGLLEKIEDRAGNSIYADPPYVEKGATYVHDFQEDEHRRLAELLGRFRLTRVVVSYYDHPLVRELYHGWTAVECPQTKALVQGNGRVKGAVEAPEILLINGESLTAGGLFA